MKAVITSLNTPTHQVNWRFETQAQPSYAPSPMIKSKADGRTYSVNLSFMWGKMWGKILRNQKNKT